MLWMKLQKIHLVRFISALTSSCLLAAHFQAVRDRGGLLQSLFPHHSCIYIPLIDAHIPLFQVERIQPISSHVEVSVTLVAFLRIFLNLLLPSWHRDQNWTRTWGVDTRWIIELHKHVVHPLHHFILTPPKDFETSMNTELAFAEDSLESLQDLFPEQ